MEELHFFSTEVTVLGTYPASPFRAKLKALEAELEQCQAGLAMNS